MVLWLLRQDLIETLLSVFTLGTSFNTTHCKPEILTAYKIRVLQIFTFPDFVRFNMDILILSDLICMKDLLPPTLVEEVMFSVLSVCLSGFVEPTLYTIGPMFVMGSGGQSWGIFIAKMQIRDCGRCVNAGALTSCIACILKLDFCGRFSALQYCQLKYVKFDR